MTTTMTTTAAVNFELAVKMRDDARALIGILDDDGRYEITGHHHGEDIEIHARLRTTNTGQEILTLHASRAGHPAATVSIYTTPAGPQARVQKVYGEATITRLDDWTFETIVALRDNFAAMHLSVPRAGRGWIVNGQYIHPDDVTPGHRDIPTTEWPTLDAAVTYLRDCGPR